MSSPIFHTQARGRYDSIINLGAVCTPTLSLQVALFSATRQDDVFFGIGTTQWLVLQKDKDAQHSCAIAVDIVGALSK